MRTWGCVITVEADGGQDFLGEDQQAGVDPDNANSVAEGDNEVPLS